MKDNKLFQKTRLQLAIWYALVMGLILVIGGLILYNAVYHSYWITLDRELQSVAGTLHDSIESKLKKPGELEPIIQKLLPNICLVESNCMSHTLSNENRHVLTAINRGNYYVRLFDNSGNLVAIAGNYPAGLSPIFNKAVKQTLFDNPKNTYYQISYQLHTINNQNWGYLQVGRSLADFTNYLTNVTLNLAVGIPLTLILVTIAGWWLARLAMQPIYQSYHQIKQFTSDAAHELRTPLAALEATVESALLMPKLSFTETTNLLQTIQRQNQRLTNLVTDLLLLSRLDYQTNLIFKESCCLNDMIKDLIEELAALAIASDITLSSSVSDLHPILVMGNQDQLYRLLSNLIINAIQYTPGGGTVTITLGDHDHWAVISIIDNGIGIAKSEIPLIFNRFYRVNSDRSRTTGGSGLGLAIAQSIAIAHQGSISVQSKLNQGSVFIIKLPLQSD